MSEQDLLDKLKAWCEEYFNVLMAQEGEGSTLLYSMTQFARIYLDRYDGSETITHSTFRRYLMWLSAWIKKTRNTTIYFVDTIEECDELSNNDLPPQNGDRCRVADKGDGRFGYFSYADGVWENDSTDIELLFEHINNANVHVSANDRALWYDKPNCYKYSTAGESAFIPATTHKCGTSPVVSCTLSGAVVLCDVDIGANGDVSVKWNGAIIGMIITIIGK